MEVEISLDRLRDSRRIVFTFYPTQTEILWLLQPVAVSPFERCVDGPFFTYRGPLAGELL